MTNIDKYEFVPYTNTKEKSYADAFLPYIYAGILIYIVIAHIGVHAYLGVLTFFLKKMI